MTREVFDRHASATGDRPACKKDTAYRDTRRDNPLPGPCWRGPAGAAGFAVTLQSYAGADRDEVPSLCSKRLAARPAVAAATAGLHRAAPKSS